jgi:hypothetical protein
LVGYYIADEPKYTAFPYIAELIAKIQAIDTNRAHIPYVNLWAFFVSEKTHLGGTYEDYLRNFIATVKPPVVSTDYYPIHYSLHKNKEFWMPYHSQIQMVASESKKAGLPFWAYINSVEYDATYPPPTVDDLRMQIYPQLAYGAQAILYYTYYEDGNGLFNMKTKTKTASWTAAQTVNRELAALSKVFLNAKVLWTRYAYRLPHPDLPPVLFNESMLPSAIRSLQADNGETLLVSRLEKGGDAFLVVLGTEINSAPVVRMKGTSNLYRVRKEDGSVVSAKGKQTYPLSPGEPLILFWKQ